MKTLESPNDSSSSLSLLESVLSTTELSDYTSVDLDLPLHVHESTGAPDLGAEAIHIFPDGFDDSSADIDDHDQGDDRFIVVRGNMTCRNLFSANWIGVQGRIKATVVHGRSGCNRGLIAHTLEATLVLEEGHSFELETLRASVVYSEHGMIEEPQGESVGRFGDDPTLLFLPKFMQPLDGHEDECEVLFEALADAVVNGERWKIDG